MITPDLAADIKNGVAQYKTFVCGIGAANRLPVAKNSRIIICDILIMPFIDVMKEDLVRLDQNRVIVYEFASRESKNHYTIRHQFQTVLDTMGTIAALVMENPVKIDTYLVHTSEVRINIYHLPLNSAFTITFAPLDDVSQEPNPPVGFGTKNSGAGINVVTNCVLAVGDNQVIPVGSQNNDPAANPVGITYIDQVKSANIAANALIDPSGINHTNSYPIINIGYVLYQDIMKSKVKPS